MTMLKDIKYEIDKEIFAYLESLRKKSPTKELAQCISYALLGAAKRVRPLLMVATALGLKKNPDLRVLRQCIYAALAVELLHNYTLIHDDLPCMDNDDYRRGKLSVHKKFGDTMAVLAGDALLTDAFYYASQSKNNGAQIVKVLAQACGSQGVVAGQALDMELKKKSLVTHEDWQVVNIHKTAMLFAASCKIGALALDAGQKEQNLSFELGLAFGAFFQICDDISDETSFCSAPASKDEAYQKVINLAHKFPRSNEILALLGDVACYV